jgi:peptidoglycan/LPS O-acetylase OafA/YrhL
VEPRRVWFAQAIRAVACLTVILAHYSQLFVTAPEVVARLALFPPVVNLPQPAYLRLYELLESCCLSVSHFAVALFFLVSGFVIPFSLQRDSLGGFFVRRFFRIYPGLWVVQLVLLAVLACQARLHHLAFPYRPAVVAGNALLVNSYLGHPFIEGVCWTLLMEELFYVVCALCAWQGVLDRPATVVLAGLGLAGVALATSFVVPSPTMPRWQPGLHWLGVNATFVVFIFVGVVLHYLYGGAWRLRQGLPLIVGLLGLYALGCFHGALRHTGGSATFFVSALAALGLFVPLLVLNRRLPYSRWLDRLAEISYPLYLVHATLGYIVIRAVYLGTGSLYLGFATAFVGAVALAALVHRFVERPGIALGKRLAARLRRPPPAPVVRRRYLGRDERAALLAGRHGRIEYHGGKTTLPDPPGYVHASSHRP